MNRTGDFRKSERGQAMVLIVLTIVAVFGFGALAIDMGQILYARRSAQAAADSAAMAAAFDASAGSKNRVTAMNKAVAMANTNGFNNDGVTNTVVVNNGPVGGPYCEICGLPNAKEYFQVRITVMMKPIFAQFIYSGAEQTTVEAIARAKSSGPVSGTDALVALSTDSDAFDFDGTTSVIVHGGNIRSNGGMTKNGNSGAIEVPTPGHVYYGGTFAGHTGPFKPVDPHDPATAKPEFSAARNVSNFTAPYCPTAGDLTSWTWNNTSKYYSKKIDLVNYYYYPKGLTVSNLASGVHCVNVENQNDDAIGKGNFTGTGVLIVLLKGGIKQTGGDSIDFRAASSLIDKNGTQLGGMVFYIPADNKSELKFGGNSDAYLEGTFFAPGAFCNIGGTPDGKAYHSAFICNKIKIHGNPIFSVDYKAEEQLRLSSSVELVQ